MAKFIKNRKSRIPTTNAKPSLPLIESFIRRPRSLEISSEKGSRLVKPDQSLEKAIVRIPSENKQRNQQNLRELLIKLQKENQLIRRLDYQVALTLLEHCQLCSFKENRIVFEPFSDADCFYIILNGTLSLSNSFACSFIQEGDVIDYSLFGKNLFSRKHTLLRKQKLLSRSEAVLARIDRKALQGMKKKLRAMNKTHQFSLMLCILKQQEQRSRRIL